jgi:hypothetical protein
MALAAQCAVTCQLHWRLQVSAECADLPSVCLIIWLGAARSHDGCGTGRIMMNCDRMLFAPDQPDARCMSSSTAGSRNFLTAQAQGPSGFGPPPPMCRLRGAAMVTHGAAGNIGAGARSRSLPSRRGRARTKDRGSWRDLEAPGAGAGAPFLPEALPGAGSAGVMLASFGPASDLRRRLPQGSLRWRASRDKPAHSTFRGARASTPARRWCQWARTARRTNFKVELV